MVMHRACKRSAADPDVDLAPYDNDGNGYVDAFIVVHAGSGAEETGSTEDLDYLITDVENDPLEGP